MARLELSDLDLANVPAEAEAACSLQLTQSVVGERDASTAELLPLAPVSLVAVLPKLEELTVMHSDREAAAVYSHYDIAAGLRGHPLLRELRLAVRTPKRTPKEARAEPPECTWSCWAPGRAPLRTMPRLQVLQLQGCRRLGLEELLADAAGCPALEQLEVRYDQEAHEEEEVWGEHVQWEPPLTGAGLQLLACGAASGSLRRVVLETLARDPDGGPFRAPPVGFRLKSVAALLAGCPQLQYLQLHAVLDTKALGSKIASSDGCTETSEWAADVVTEHLMQCMITDEVRRAEELVGGLVEEQLSQLGVAAPARLRFSGYDHFFNQLLMRVAGSVGDCEVYFSMWGTTEWSWRE
jgi:hypothetical protein